MDMDKGRKTISTSEALDRGVERWEQLDELYLAKPPGYEGLPEATWVASCGFCGVTITRSPGFGHWGRRLPGETNWLLGIERLRCYAAASRRDPRDDFGFHDPDGVVR